MLDIETSLKTTIQNALKKLGVEISLDSIIIERSKDKAHGDYATTVAMTQARNLHKAPKLIAEDIVNNINEDFIDKIEIAGPGFINFFIKSDSLSSIIKTIVNEGDHYGEAKEKHEGKINVEFVSANPTGTLHLGHARGAAIGDTICRLYEKAGYNVTREYYVNDAGVQINHLADSLRVRYHEVLGDNSLVLPEDGYHSKDLLDVAKKMVAEVGDKYLVDSKEGYTYFMRRGTKFELDKLIEDLKEFRVKFDVFSSELDIRNAGKVEEVLKLLDKYTYKEDNALFLKTTDFTDDKDRVLIKSDGNYTYLLPDIAYHKNKMDRGFDTLIDVLGADHHGYIERMKSSLAMLGYNPNSLNIELIQMVRLFKNGEEYKMSKRTGNAVGMKELCDEVGVDAVRYFFISRAASSHLDFDLDLASKMESSNPVYYAQYAHARLSQVLDKGKDIALDLDGKLLKEEKELALLKVISEFPKEVATAAEARAPYKITNYIQKLATSIHEFYSECRVIDESNLELTSSRLALAKASKIVMKNALEVIGVSAPEKNVIMEDIKMTKSRIDIAFDIVKENGEPIEFLSLWEKVCEALGEDPSSKVGKIGKLYTDLLEDGRFVNRPNNTWDLKEKYTFDEVKKPDMDFYSDDEEELDDVEEIKEIREEEKALFDEEDEEDEESLELDSNDDEEEKQSSEEDY